LVHDLARGLLRNDAQSGLRAGECGLDREAITGPRFVGENPPHLRRGENIAKDGRIERSRGHVGFSNSANSEWRIGRGLRNLSVFAIR
jgi:hypothetical protein